MAELEADMEAPDFWNDVERSNEVMKTVKSLKDTLESFDRVVDEYEELGVLIEMADEEDDASLLPEIEELLENFKQHFETLRMQFLPSMRVRVERRAVIGQGCCFVCTQGGQRKRGIPQKY